MNTLPTENTSIATPLFRRPWFMYSGLAMAVLVIMVVYNAQIPDQGHYYATEPPVPAATSDKSVEAESARLQGNELGSKDLEAGYGDQSTGLAQRDLRNTFLGRVAAGVGSVVNRMPDIPPPTTAPPITDDREFLKTDYYASLQTRHVGKLARQVQTMVRGYNGRMDSASIQPKHASLSFVIPKDSLENFQIELAELVPARFIVEYTQSTNLLPEKQIIEKETAAAQADLAALEKTRKSLVAEHAASSGKIKGRLGTIAADVQALDAILAEPETEPDQHALAREQRKILINERYNLNGRLGREDADYKNTLRDLDADIATEKARLKNATAEDKNIIDTAETVKGSVSLEWISVFGIIDLYLGAWFWVLVGGAVIIAIYFFRRRPRFELP